MFTPVPKLTSSDVQFPALIFLTPLFALWTQFMSEFATIPLYAGILIIKKMAKFLVSIFLP